ncbi:hypothetical protein ACP70R_030130 [Stipagrostis hirtigluma subsp. patula]
MLLVDLNRPTDEGVQVALPDLSQRLLEDEDIRGPANAADVHGEGTQDHSFDLNIAPEQENQILQCYLAQ